MNPIVIKSRVELSPNSFYDIETELPIWLLVLLAASSAFLIKEIYNSLT